MFPLKIHMATFERVFLVRRSCKLHSNRTSISV